MESWHNTGDICHRQGCTQFAANRSIRCAPPIDQLSIDTSVLN